MEAIQVARTGEEPVAEDVRARVVAAAGGDEAAFRDLYEQHARGIYNMVLRSVRDERAAEDLCQEIWMKAYRGLAKLREPDAFGPWLYRIAAKRCIDASRHRSRRPNFDSLEDHVTDGRGDPEAAALGREDAELTWEALAALPPHQHLALFLKEVEGRSYREISRILDVSETAVGLCLLRARRSLMKSHQRLMKATAAERCGRLRAALVAVVDGEGNEVQRRAVGAHIGNCRPCEREAAAQRVASRRYAAFALAPVPALLSARILAHSAAAAGMTASAGSVAKALVTILARAKPLAMTLTAAGGLTAAAFMAPDSRPLPVYRAPAPAVVAPASALPPEANLDAPSTLMSTTGGDPLPPPSLLFTQLALPAPNELLAPVAIASDPLRTAVATAIAVLPQPPVDLLLTQTPGLTISLTPGVPELPQPLP